MPLPGLDPAIVTAVAVVDADGDGDADDVVVGTVAGQPTLVYLGDGSGSYQDVEPLSVPDAGSVSQIISSDQDGDGEPDLVLGHEDGPAVVYLSDESTDKPGDFGTAMNNVLGDPESFQPAVTAFDHDDNPATPAVLIVGSSNGVDTIWPEGGAFESEGLDIPGTEALVTTSIGVGSIDGDEDNSDVLLGTEAGLYLMQNLLETADPSKLPSDSTPILVGPSDAVDGLDVGDLNGDSVDDVVVIGTDATSVYLGDPGALPPLQDSLTLPLPTEVDGAAVEIVDVDEDGVSDVLVSTSDGQSLLYTNDGKTPFDGGSSPLSPPKYLSPPTPGAPGLDDPTSADFNGGLLEATPVLGGPDAPDVISGNFIYSNPAHRDGDGSWRGADSSQYWYGPVPQATVALDADNDGDVDLLVFPRAEGGADESSTSPVLLLNPGDGDFSRAERVPLPTLPSGKKVGDVDVSTDLNGDGLVDVVVAYDDSTQENLLILNPGSTAQWMGIDPLGLPGGAGGSSVELTSKDVTVVSLDGNGAFEILTADGATGRGMTSTTYDPDGAITARDNVPDVSELAPTSIAYGQLNVHEDLATDLVLAGPDGARVLFGEGDGTLLSWAGEPVAVGKTTPPAAGDVGERSIGALEVADVDGDGSDDVVIAYEDAVGGRGVYYGGLGAGTSPADWEYTSLVPSQGAEDGVTDEMVLLDVNADGALDMVYIVAGAGRPKIVLGTNVPNPAVADADALAAAQEEMVGDMEVAGGSGTIVDDSMTTVVGDPMDPATAAKEHAPCRDPGSDVTPVTTSLLIDFPIIPCDPLPDCILLDPILLVDHVSTVSGSGLAAACSFVITQTDLLVYPAPSEPPPLPQEVGDGEQPARRYCLV